jgi:hypothetical protein
LCNVPHEKQSRIFLLHSFLVAVTTDIGAVEYEKHCRYPGSEGSHIEMAATRRRRRSSGVTAKGKLKKGYRYLKGGKVVKAKGRKKRTARRRR